MQGSKITVKSNFIFHSDFFDISRYYLMKYIITARLYLKIPKNLYKIKIYPIHREKYQNLSRK